MTISPYARLPARRTAPRGSSWWRRAGLLVLVLVGLVAVWLGIQSSVQNRLRDTLQGHLDGCLQGSALSARIEKAEFIPDQGIRLYDVSLRMHDPSSHSQLLHLGQSSSTEEPLVGIEIYEAFVQMPVTLPELLIGSARPAAVQIRRARIRLLQSASGDWNIGSLLEQLAGLKVHSSEKIPVDFRDCSIELVTRNPNFPSLTFSDVRLTAEPIEHEGRMLTRIQGAFSGRDVSGTQFVLHIDEDRQTWQAHFKVPQFRISPNLLVLIPQEYRDGLSSWPQIEGTISGQGSASGDTQFAQPTQFSLAGHLKGFTCEDPAVPLPIRQASLDFELSDQQLKVKNASGRLGDGRFQFDFSQSGLTGTDAWQMNGRLDRFNFGYLERLLPWLPQNFVTIEERYKPRGIANIQFELGETQGRSIRKLKTELIDTSFAAKVFPYPLEHCTGEGVWIGERCEFRLDSKNGPKHIEITGNILNPGPLATFQIDVKTSDDMPIDDKLQTAMEVRPALKQVVNDFRPNGRIGVAGRVARSHPDQPITAGFDVRLNQCTVRHNRFDYPIFNITGLIQVRDKTFDFVNLNGNSSGCPITANGRWTPVDGLDMRFVCKSVPLDNQLRNAISPELQRVWYGFRPTGTIDVGRVDLRKPIGSDKLAVSIEAIMDKPTGDNDPHSVSIKPIWFPYELQQLRGTIKIGDGRITLTDISGQHGRTWVTCQGEGEYNEETWWLGLRNLLVGSLKVDEDLLAAVPKNLTSHLRKLSYEGLLNMQGEVTLAGRAGDSANPQGSSSGHRFLAEALQDDANLKSSVSLAWNVRFDMNQAKMKIGLPLDNIYGAVQLKGQYDGNRVECEGELGIDSLMVHGVRITGLTGPVMFNGERAAAGMFVKSQEMQSLQSGIAPENSAASSARPLTGKLYDGVFKLDAQVANDSTGEFYLQTTVADACLAQFCKDNASRFSDVEGRSYAMLRLTGNGLGTHSLRGDGRVQLRQAAIMELPVIFAVLKSMRVGTRSQTAFDSSNVDFRIAGEEIEFTRFEMLGEPVSLLGNGKANLNREIDLNFYSVAGKNRFNIPILSDLYRASSQQVLWINVNGTVDDPQTHRNVLPQLNDSLKQLFQPVEYRQAVR